MEVDIIKLRIDLDLDFCFQKSYVELMRLIMWQKYKINMSPLSSFSWGSVRFIPVLPGFRVFAGMTAVLSNSY